MIRQKKAVTLVELVAVVGIFLIMASALTPFARMIKERAGRITCANNLMRISLGLHTYASENNDVFPPNLGALYPNYVNDEKTFDCPTSKTVGTKEAPDYDYTPGLTEDSPAKNIIAQDLDGNHKGAGRHILRVNGSVEWIETRGAVAKR